MKWKCPVTERGHLVVKKRGFKKRCIFCKQVFTESWSELANIGGKEELAELKRKRDESRKSKV